MDALEIIQGMIVDEAEYAAEINSAFPRFDRIGAGAGSGIRLAALIDIRNALVSEGIRELEEPNGSTR